MIDDSIICTSLWSGAGCPYDCISKLFYHFHEHGSIGYTYTWPYAYVIGARKRSCLQGPRAFCQRTETPSPLTARSFDPPCWSTVAGIAACGLRPNNLAYPSPFLWRYCGPSAFIVDCPTRWSFVLVANCHLWNIWPINARYRGTSASWSPSWSSSRVAPRKMPANEFAM